MALTAIELSKQQALEAAGLVCMPNAVSSGSSTVWLKAVALVKKINGTQSYALLEYDGEKQRIKRDFGASAQIISIEEIYPYESLEKRFIPKLTSDEDYITYLLKMSGSDKEVRKLLSTDGKSDEKIKEDRAKVKAMVMKYAIAAAQVTLNDELKYKKALEANNTLEDESQERQETKNADSTTKNKRGRKPNKSKL